MACAALVPDLALASALAVALSVAIMVPLRCLHPPGAALALFAVLQHEHGAAVAAFPVLFNTIVLLTVGIAYNTLTGRNYPYAQRVASNSAGMPQGQFTSSDLDAALGIVTQTDLMRTLAAATVPSAKCQVPSATVPRCHKGGRQINHMALQSSG
jgi:CBS domain-containing membrane protein